MRLLLLNGNTNTAMTEQMAQRARQLLAPDIDVVADTAHDSVAYIGSRRECTLAATALIKLVEKHLARKESEYDAILLACFGEPGIAAVREITSLPVIGMLEASVLSALQLGGRFSIITPGQRWPRMIDDMLHNLGVTRHCAGVDAIVLDDLTLPEQREVARQRLAATFSAQQTRLAPETVIVGGAALAGLTKTLGDAGRCHVIDSLDAALMQTQALMMLTAEASSG